jgi:hypothetical protein
LRLLALHELYVTRLKQAGNATSTAEDATADSCTSRRMQLTLIKIEVRWRASSRDVVPAAVPQETEEVQYGWPENGVYDHGKQLQYSNQSV